jgi:class 3 adenylate cyclase/CHASE2 domain-containing sensor protein
MSGESASRKSTMVSPVHLLIGVVVSGLIIALSWTHVYQDQEASLYDFRFLLRNDLFQPPEQFDRVATIDIDDLALQTYGWPLSRDRHAALIDVLHQYQAGALGFDIFFYEPSASQLSREDILQLEGDGLTKEQVLSLIKDFDADLLRAARSSGIAYMAQTFEVAEQGAEFSRQNLRKQSPEKAEAIAALAPFSAPLTDEASRGMYHTTDMEYPLIPFIGAAKGVGFALPKPDHDGIVRRYRLVLAYDDRVYFALGFVMACDYLQVPLSAVRFVPGECVELPNAQLPDGSTADVRIPITDRFEMLVNWAGPYHTTFRHLPYNLVLDFAENEPRDRALKAAKRIAARNPGLLGDDEAYLATAMGEGVGDIDPNLLMEMKYVVSDCIAMEEALAGDPNMTVTAFIASLGIPEEEIPAVAEILGDTFARIKTNRLIHQTLSDDPSLSLEEVGHRMGVERLEDIKLGVGIIRDLMRRGGVTAEDHPLFFLDRITSGGLHGSQTADRIVTRDDLKGSLFLYGLTATGTHDLNPTPFGAREPMLGAHVNVLNTILTRSFLHRIPAWGNLTVVLVLGLLVGFLVPRFRALPGAGVILLLLAVYVTVAFLVFVYAGIWIDVLGPVAALVIGYLSITLYNYVQKEKEKEFVQGAFGHYLDPKVVDQLVENPEHLGQLGGDQREMTAFFSDVASFSTISENLTPVELVELLNEYLSEMCDIVAEHGGTIDKFEGDLIMAFYGAPIKVDDHASRAVQGAIDMQVKLVELRERWVRENRMAPLRQLWEDQGRGDFFTVRIGINTGEMVVGNMGSRTRVDYTIMGDAVNLASRLEGAGKAYGVTTMLSEDAYRAAREGIEVRELDSIKVVGKDEPVRVYEILGRTGAIDPALTQAADLYAEGLAAYRGRKWDEAISSFEAGLSVRPGDGPCAVFIDRCRDYKVDPPPEDWDSVHSLDEK